MSQFLRAAVVLVGSTFLVGCSYLEPISDLFGSDDISQPPTPLVQFEPKIELEKEWSKSAGKGNDELYLRLAPAHAGNHLFVVDIEGRLFAFNKNTGKKLWETKTEKRVTGGLGVLNNTLVLLGTADGEVIAYNQETGEEVWQAQLESEILAAPKGSGKRVVAYAANNTVYGLDASTGKIDWKVNNTMPALVLRGNSAPLIMGDQVVYVGLNNGRVLALNIKDGSRLWEHVVSASRGRSELQRMVDISGDMAIEDSTLYVVSYQGEIAALALSTGIPRWEKEMSSYSGVSANKKYLTVSDSDDVVYLLSINNGDTVWKQENLMYRDLTLPIFWEDYVVVGDKEGYLHILSLKDGAFVGRIEVGGDGMVVPPVVISMQGKEALYVLTNSGKLHVYTMAK